MSRSFWETVIVIIIAVLLFIGLRLTIQTYIVYGPSMQPNYYEDQSKKTENADRTAGKLRHVPAVQIQRDR